MTFDRTNKWGGSTDITVTVNGVNGTGVIAAFDNATNVSATSGRTAGTFYITHLKLFYGLPPNNEYPQEDIRLNRTIANTGTKSQGTVDSVIVESAGENYGVGDRLTVDNSRTFGSDFSAFVSRVRGKDLRKKTDGSIDLVKSSNGLTVTFQTNDPHYLAIGDYVYFDYKQPLDPAT